MIRSYSSVAIQPFIYMSCDFWEIGKSLSAAVSVEWLAQGGRTFRWNNWSYGRDELFFVRLFVHLPLIVQNMSISANIYIDNWFFYNLPLFRIYLDEWESVVSWLILFTAVVFLISTLNHFFLKKIYFCHEILPWNDI